MYAGAQRTGSELDAEAAHIGLLVAHEAHDGERVVRVQHVERKRAEAAEAAQRLRLLFRICSSPCACYVTLRCVSALSIREADGAEREVNEWHSTGTACV